MAGYGKNAPGSALNVIKLRILHSVKKYPPPFLRGGYFTFWLIHIERTALLKIIFQQPSNESKEESYQKFEH